MNMTTFFDREFDRIFKSMPNSFFVDGIFEEFGKRDSGTGPYYYGCTMTIGPDGKPVVREYGNAKQSLLSETNESAVDTIVDEKDKTVKLVAEMPGVEKTDIKIAVDSNIVDIRAEHGEKTYHAKVPLRHKVDEDSAKASYKNGILQITFRLITTKPDSKKVEVE